MWLYIVIVIQLLLAPYTAPVQSVPSIIQSILELANHRGEESSCTSCPCTTHLDPICGTDSVTYNNKCIMNCAILRCPTKMKGVSVSHKGKCEEKTFIKKDCSGGCSCGRSYEPVCGSDGVTYTSKCSFYCSKSNCQSSMKEVSIAYSGGCKEREVKDENCYGCTCIRRFDPICGSNNRTFNNQCIFDCAKKKCPEMMRGIAIEYSGTCGINLDNRRDPEDCFAGCHCTRVMAPMCGSNGETFNNKCMFDCKKRKCPNAMQSVEIQYSGKCGGRTDGRRDQENCFQNCHCTRIITPLCGSNGETFNNKCMFNCKKRNCPNAMKSIEIHHSGKCGGRPYGRSDQENCFQNCHCTRIMAPLCGSNGETFNNECMFNCKKRNCPNTMRGIILRSEGRCDHPRPNESCFACICPRGGMPVCGTDRYDYANECMFQCAKRRCRAAMRGVGIRYRGRCGLPR